MEVMAITPREIKQNLNKLVTWKSRNGVDGGIYKLTGVTFRRNDKTGEFYYQCILEDKARRVVIVRMDEVYDTQ